MNMLKQLALTAAFWGLSLAASAADVSALQQRWAQIHYETAAQTASQGLRPAGRRARQLTDANPDSAAAHIWQGIILSSLGGRRGRPRGAGQGQGSQG